MNDLLKKISNRVECEKAVIEAVKIFGELAVVQTLQGFATEREHADLAAAYDSAAKVMQGAQAKSDSEFRQYAEKPR